MQTHPARLKSSAAKEIEAEYSTTIPPEPCTAHKVQGKPYFCTICPWANDNVYAN